MKKTILTIILIIFCTIHICKAQDAKSYNIKLCNKTAGTISVAELTQMLDSNCIKITTLEKNCVITSYTIVHLSSQNAYFSAEKGNRLSPEMIKRLRKSNGNGDSITIRELEILDGRQKVKTKTNYTLTITQ